jgi:hypothetical protein
MTKREEMENAIFELGFVPLARRSLIGEPRLRLDAFLDKWAPTENTTSAVVERPADPLSRIESALLRLVQVEAMRGANEARRIIHSDPSPVHDESEFDGQVAAAAREREMEGPKT